jgi:hypothetical protein
MWNRSKNNSKRSKKIRKRSILCLKTVLFYCSIKLELWEIIDERLPGTFDEWNKFEIARKYFQINQNLISFQGPCWNLVRLYYRRFMGEDREILLFFIQLFISCTKVVFQWWSFNFRSVIFVLNRRLRNGQLFSWHRYRQIVQRGNKTGLDFSHKIYDCDEWKSV